MNRNAGKGEHQSDDVRRKEALQVEVHHAVASRRKPDAERPEHRLIDDREQRHIQKPRVREERREQRHADESGVAENEAEHEHAVVIGTNAHRLRDKESHHGDRCVEYRREQDDARIVLDHLPCRSVKRRPEQQHGQKYFRDKIRELRQIIPRDDRKLPRRKADGQDEEEYDHPLKRYFECHYQPLLSH